MYKIIRSIFFLFDAERAHYLAMNLLKVLCSVGFIKNRIEKNFSPKQIQVHLLGMNFKNPVGLGAGFDKNALYLRELETLGFGFIEIGTVTPKPQEGNDKPRLFRLKKDNALINRMGFNNDGAEIIVERLKSWRKNNVGSKLIIGGNIGKNKITANEDAWKDYEICFDALHPYVDFFVVNVRSPNTPGLRELQEKDALKKILTHLQIRNKALPIQKPILLKIAPDLTLTQIDDVIDLAKEITLDGLVATNTTIDRTGLTTTEDELFKIGSGGLSGKPLQKRSTEIVKYIVGKTDGKIPVIGSGGIFNASDANEKIAAGASLVEVWTGFIYEGPGIVKNICKSLKMKN
jgi:dihydroorotate dehydrogenase